MLSKNITQLQQRIKGHYDADEIVKGIYWENGKGCAVGCSLHSGNHKKGETEFGVPEPIWWLVDSIFEGLPNAEAKEFPLQFSLALREGADYSKVTGDFLFWLVDEELKPWHGDAIVGGAILGVRDALVSGEGLLEATEVVSYVNDDTCDLAAQATTYVAWAARAYAFWAARAYAICASDAEGAKGAGAYAAYAGRACDVATCTYTDAPAARKRQAEKLLALITETL
jgi:hypothetical protein